MAQKIKVWQCKYCDHYRRSKLAVEQHERTCLYGKRVACVNCKHRRPDRPSCGMGHVHIVVMGEECDSWEKSNRYESRSERRTRKRKNKKAIRQQIEDIFEAIGNGVYDKEELVKLTITGENYRIVGACLKHHPKSPEYDPEEAKKK